MKTIEQMAVEYCTSSPELGELVTLNGVEGIRFLDENEFIPFDDLAYNSEFGFFKKSQFPDEPNEAMQPIK